ASNSWTQMTPSIKPSARSFYSMAYDSISDKVILFGGAGGGKINDETWIYDYDFNTWTLKAPSIKPKARCYHSMTFNFDSSVLFGGWDFSSHLSDTWLYDLPTDTWTQMAPPTIPKARWGHSMVSDSAFDKVILFGGYFSSGWGADHTWIYPVNKQYYQSGLFESRITYLGNTYEISGDITWSPSVQPENTSLKLQIGFSNTTLAEDFHYTDYHTSDFSFTGYTQYLRYRAIFDTNMTLFLSPTLESVTIYYSWETTLNTIPNAPQDLSAIADENFIELNWTAPSDDGGSVVTRYNVYRGTESGEYIFLGLTPKTNFTDSAVEGGTMYYYVITAVNIIGESPFSQEVSVLSSGTPEIPTTVPSAPQNLSATTKFKFIELNWTAPNDNGGSIIMSYRIYRGTSSGVYLLIGIVVAPTTSYNDTLILSKTTYFYAVTAINALGESVFSDEVSATSKRSKITPFPDFPTILIFLGVSVMLIRKFKKK
ncbi:MAG: kelch repeat-containing protein, partial [Candidatus Hodarchaeota archaeon]